MNWFERYAIPGSFTYGLILVYIKLMAPGLLKDTTTFVIIGAFSSTALGYIVSVYSQWLIYKLPFDKINIHRLTIRNLHEKGISIPNEILNTSEEIVAETWLALRHREVMSDKLMKHREAILDWARRRWDILSIDFSLIVSLIIFILFIVIGIIYQIAILRHSNPLLFWFSLFISSVTVCILIKNRNLLMRQLIIAYADTFPTFFNNLNAEKQNVTEKTELNLKTPKFDISYKKK